MNDEPMVSFWKGKPMESLDRDELLVVIDYLMREKNAVTEKMNKMRRAVDWRKYLVNPA